MKLKHLFSPITINGMTLKNRAVMPPMGTGYGNADGTVGDRLIEYFARRAREGTGLIIEVCAADPAWNPLDTPLPSFYKKIAS